MLITTCGHPVRTNSPGCSVRRLSIVRSANVSAVSRPVLLVALLLTFPLELLALLLILFVLFDAFETHVSMFICVVDDTSVARCMFSLSSLLISVVQVGIFSITIFHCHLSLFHFVSSSMFIRIAENCQTRQTDSSFKSLIHFHYGWNVVQKFIN